MPQSNLSSGTTEISSNGVFWYSYSFGNVHTTVISTEHDLTLGSPQHSWLEADLASVDRSVTPWLIVEMHRPLYGWGGDSSNIKVSSGMSNRIERLLLNYKVDVVLSGHYHTYFRSCDGMFRNNCHNGGPMYLTIGTAGANVGTTIQTATDSRLDKTITGVYGYGRVTVYNASALHFEFVEAGPSDNSSLGQVLDDAWVLRYRS